MIPTLCFVTRNAHKREEIAAQLGNVCQLLTLDEMGCTEEIPEPEDTIEGNAIYKARYVCERYQIPCFADDSGLEVFALNGAPGVHSAYYAGKARDFKANYERVLQELKGICDRRAQFKTVIALALPNGKVRTFTGIITGVITEAPRGSNGFGYDPIFQPDGYGITFGEMETSLKTRISHRARAMQQLLDFLRSQNIND
ncbi:MAG: RdgB/HAM1 family non-canonical purine NTP pyrophosphatase [Cytophagales bacterium]|nr:RdgB/HAM1 family non-canonical purine NTP pyrophosphatase [Bernardetiaceae bacterium]MDW8204459.1 RdgB/HAM1 family non-canonical purine NTP pyrophosphatase [Cytophagales bacterium]